MEFALGPLLIGLAVNAALAAAAFLAGAVGGSGVVAGVVVGTIIFYALGWAGWGALVTFFVMGSGLSKLGYARKASLGVAQESGGRRGAKHAAANCGTALLCCLAVLLLGPGAAYPYLVVAFIGAFATALADTTGSEFGQLYGRTPILITTFKRVPVGTEGAVSLEGTVAGIAASGLIAAFGMLLLPSRFGWAGLVAVVLGAFIGTTAESYIGATFERAKKIDNEVVNFANTVIGGGASALLYALLV